MDKSVKFRIELATNGKKVLHDIKVDAEDFDKALKKVTASANKMTSELEKSAQMSLKFQSTIDAIERLNGMMSNLSGAYAVQQQAETQLATTMRNSMDATDGEIQSIKDLCAAQQELGIIGDEVQIAGAQELATYLEKKESLEKLIPVLNDMNAQQYGLNATTESSVTIASMLGKVMEGQVGALSRYGYKFDEAQEHILKFGTEEERVAVLTDVVSASVGGMNQQLAQTDVGKQKQLENTLGDIKEQLGNLVQGAMPFITMAAQAGQAVTAILMLNNSLKGTVVAGVLTKSWAIAQGMAFKVLTSSAYAANAGFKALTATTAAMWGVMTMGVSVVIYGLVKAFDALGEKADEAAEKVDHAAEEAKTAQQTFTQTQADTYSKLMSKFIELQNSWKKLSGQQAKKQWIKNHRKELEELGLKVGTVTQAENVFKNNTDTVVEAFKQRAKAAALAAQLAEEYGRQMRLALNIQERDKAAQGRHKSVVAGEKYEYDPNFFKATTGTYENAKKSGYVTGYHHNYTTGRNEYTITSKGAEYFNSLRWRANDAETKGLRKALDESKARSAELEKQIDVEKNKPVNIPTVPEPVKKTTKNIKADELIVNAKSYEELTHNVQAYQKQIEKCNPADNERIATLKELKEDTQKAAYAVKDLIEGWDMEKPATLEEVNEAIRRQDELLQKASKDQIVGIEEKKKSLNALKDELEAASFKELAPEDIKSYEQLEEQIAHVEKAIKKADDTTRGALIQQRNELNKLKEKWEEVDAEISKPETDIAKLNTIEDLEKAIQYYEAKVQKLTATEAAATRKQINLLKEKLSVFDAIISKPETDLAKLNNIQDLQAAIQYYEGLQQSQSTQEAAATQSLINLYKAKLSVMQQIIDLPSMGEELSDLDGLSGKSLKLELELIGIDGIKSKIRELQKLLDNTKNPLNADQRKEVEKLIASWSGYEKQLKKSQVKLTDAWSGIKGVNNGIEGMKDALEGSGTAWQKSIAIVDSAVQMFEGFDAIVKIVKTLTAATEANTVASTASSVATTTAAGAKVAAAPEEAAASAVVIAANKAEAISFRELAASAYMAAHAYIPFAGFGIGAGFTTSMMATVGAVAVTPFADGGVLYGPTLALMGEYSGVSNNPEVVAPLNKLRDLIQPNDPFPGTRKLKFEIEARKLVAVIEKEYKMAKRS